MSGRRGGAVLAVVQARMSSSRLPGKVLTELGTGPALWQVLNRLAGAAEIASTVLATSVEPSDDPVASFGERFGVTVHRGPLEDVLSRFTGALAAAETDAAAVVRITGDCPFVDPGLVDRLVRLWRAGDADYVANVIEPRSFPKGLDVEVVSADALRAADDQASSEPDREHVTKFIRERPERFRQAGLWLDPPMPDVRVTLDTPADLDSLRALLAEVGTDPGLAELISALGGPETAAISPTVPAGS